jgi:hypothetical protein
MELSKAMPDADIKSSVVVDISSEVARLRDVVDRALIRLDSVLEPEYSVADKASSEPAPLRSFIRQTQHDLSYQVDRLIAILDRVES